MKTQKFIAAAAAVVGITGAGTAQAYIIDYGHSINGSRTTPLFEYESAINARNSFFGDGQPIVQDFEGFAENTSGPLSITFGSGSTAVTATLKGGAGKVLNVPEGTALDGRYSVSADLTSTGSKLWGTQATSTGDTFELWFDVPVVKFGFFGVDIGDFGGILELELLTGSAAAGTEKVIGTVSPSTGAVTGDEAEGSVLYFGVTANTASEYFTGVRFRTFAANRTSVAPDLFGFDSFTVVAAGTAPPTPASAPGTLALLGLALTGLALMRRRA